MQLRSRSKSVAAGLAVVAMLGLSACNATANADNKPSTGSSASGPTTSSTPTPTTPTVDWETTPKDAATAVPVDTRVTAKTEHGELTSVSMTYKSKKGNVIPADGWLESGVWTAKELLEPGVTYTLTMKAKDEAGDETTREQTFTTQDLTLDDQIAVTVTPGDGQVVGIGMPVIVTFDLPVKDRAAFEKNMKVTSTPAQAGSWYWLSDREVHWRPKAYWQPGTKVHVEANLNGVPAGNGRYGQWTRTSDFTVGRAVVAKVNLKTDQMNVFINGAQTKTIPITGGRPGFETRSGFKVIMSKVTNIVMKAETIGLKKNDPNWYADTPVKYALQLTHSGEFLHSAPWSVASQGHANVSHGCTGMSDANAAWVYQNFKIGDVVETTGTNKPMTMGNGYSDWNLPWASYQKGSAL
ncbi:MAG: L,D-transpeptidase [Intrasporangium sp.]|uniref:L,D-transpeptidase n=1 Tax=Intrasporangium sp. TaxID=1925024 RepID=UPI003F7FD441